MINLDYVKRNYNSDYLNRCIIYALTFINLLNLTKIGKLDLLIKNYNAQILSEISLIRTKIYFIMDNITTIHKNNYMNEVIDNMFHTRNITFDALSIIDLQDIINNMSSKLSDIRMLVETSDLPSNSPMPYLSLSSIYEENKPESIDSELLKHKDIVPLYFNYYEGKNTLKVISSLLKGFSVTRDKIVKNETSMAFTFISKMKLLVSSESQKMQEIVVLSENLTQINDACIIADAVYKEYEFLDSKNYDELEFNDKITVDIFLARPYKEVKKDVIKALENQLV